MDLFQFGIFKRDQIQNTLLSIGCDAHELNSVPTKRARKRRKNVLGHKSDDVSDTLLDAGGQETLQRKWTKFLVSARRHAGGGVPARAGDHADGDQDEDVGGAAPGLPEAHRSAEGVSVRQGGALHHAADWCKFGAPHGKQKGERRRGFKGPDLVADPHQQAFTLWSAIVQTKDKILFFSSAINWL